MTAAPPPAVTSRGTPWRRRRLLVSAIAVVVPALATMTAVPAGAQTEPVDGRWQGTVCGELTRVPIPVGLDLSDDGLVVGRDARPRAVSWDRSTGSVRWYGGIEGGLPSEITAVSPGGAVAGVATLRARPYDTRRAVRVDGPLPLVPVSRAADRWDDVNGVNDANVVVGTSHHVFAAGRSEAFRWSDRREVLAAPGPAFRRLEARAVNRAGAVVGRGYGPDATGTVANRALRWSPAGTVEVLPPLPDGAQLLPIHLSDGGRITGYRINRTGGGDAIVTWTAEEGYTVVPAPTPNGTPVDLFVTDATEDGTVLGAVFDPQARPSLRPFQWDRATGFHLVVVAGSSAPVADAPRALNARHEALVDVHGRPHLWTPCP